MKGLIISFCIMYFITDTLLGFIRESRLQKIEGSKTEDEHKKLKLHLSLPSLLSFIATFILLIIILVKI